MKKKIIFAVLATIVVYVVYLQIKKQRETARAKADLLSDTDATAAITRAAKATGRTFEQQLNLTAKGKQAVNTR